MALAAPIACTKPHFVRFVSGSRTGSTAVRRRFARQRVWAMCMGHRCRQQDRTNFWPYSCGSSSVGMITIRRLGRATTAGLPSPDFVTGTLGGAVKRPLTGWPLGIPGTVTRFSAGLSLLPPSPPAPIAPGIIGIPVIPTGPVGGVPPVGVTVAGLNDAAAGVVGGEDD